MQLFFFLFCLNRLSTSGNFILIESSQLFLQALNGDQEILQEFRSGYDLSQ
jgi:hypothetical protein